MFEYCPNCGTKNVEKGFFCKNCGTKLSENKKEIERFEEQIAHHQRNNNNRNKRKILVGTMMAFFIASLLIASGFLIILETQPDLTKKEYEEPIDPEEPIEPEKLDPVEYGPRVSFQSLSGGTITSIPQEGAKATYGLYDESGIFGTTGARIGEIIEENLGEKTFQGEKCILVKTEGKISIPMNEYKEAYTEVSSSFSSTDEQMLNMIPDEIPFYIYSDYYIKKDDNTPVYMDYKIDCTEFFQIIKEISEKTGYTDETGAIEFNKVIIGFTIDWNKEESNAEMSFYMEGISFMEMDESFTVEFSEGYWEMEPEMKDLYVGFEKIVNFTMKMKTDDFSYSIDYEEEESEYEIEEKQMTAIETEDYAFEEYSYSTTTMMKINVIDQEDVNLSCGLFEDCYVIEVEQNQNSGFNSYDYYDSSSSTSTTKIWVAENGVMPKAEYTFLSGSTLGASSSNQKLLLILEEYTK